MYIVEIFGKISDVFSANAPPLVTGLGKMLSHNLLWMLRLWREKIYFEFQIVSITPTYKAGYKSQFVLNFFWGEGSYNMVFIH